MDSMDSSNSTGSNSSMSSSNTGSSRDSSIDDGMDTSYCNDQKTTSHSYHYASSSVVEMNTSLKILYFRILRVVRWLVGRVIRLPLEVLSIA